MACHLVALRVPFIGCKFNVMKPIVDPLLKTDEIDGPIERGYDAWKRAKIERGLAQTQDLDVMIPVEQILAYFTLER